MFLFFAAGFSYLVKKTTVCKCRLYTLRIQNFFSAVVKKSFGHVLSCLFTLKKKNKMYK